MKMKYLLVVASLVVGLSVCNVLAWTQLTSPTGYSIVKVYKDINSSAYFIYSANVGVSNQCIVIYDLDQPSSKRFELLLDNAFLYGKKITSFCDGNSTNVNSWWYDANDVAGNCAQFPIYAKNTSAFIRIK